MPLSVTVPTFKLNSNTVIATIKTAKDFKADADKLCVKLVPLPASW